MLLTHDQLFLCTIQDLRNKISVGKEYEVIRAAGLCRHLLCDGTSLLDIVNRQYRTKITFHLADWSDDPFYNVKGLTVSWRTILPKSDKTKYVRQKEFLKTVLLSYYQHEYTVRDIIRAASHYLGGVHSYAPENKKQDALTALDKTAKTKEKVTLLAIKAVCQVVLSACEPLEEIIIMNQNKRQLAS